MPIIINGSLRPVLIVPDEPRWLLAEPVVQRHSKDT